MTRICSPWAVVLNLAILSLLLAACASQTPTPPPTLQPSPVVKPAAATATTPPKSAATAAPAAEKGPATAKIKLGILASVSDSGVLLAREKSYFKEQGLDVEYFPFTSAAEMIAPLGTGQLDVGGGSPGVGLANAFARNVDIKIVADKGSTPKGFGFEAVLVRKDLWDAGVRKPADFKGRRASVSSTAGVTAETALNNALRAGGVRARDLDLVQMAHPDSMAALAGKSIDIAVTIEPYVTKIAEDGVGVIYGRTDEFAPGHQVAVVLYAGKFIKENPDAAKRVMVAYLKGVRDYNDAFVKKDPQKKAEVVSILTKFTSVKEAALYDKMAVPGLNPNGEVNKKSLAEDQDYYLEVGLQKDKVDMDMLVDPSWAQYAVGQLGVYK